MTTSNKTLPRTVKNAYSDGSHLILRLTYISRTDENMTSDELDAILKKAQEKNTKNGITGILVFNKNTFLQCIEGSRPQINDLLNVLIADKRHYDLQIVEAVEVIERRWFDWSMDYVAPNNYNKEQFLRFSPDNRFNPYLMSAEAIETMLNVLSTTKLEAVKEEEQKKPRLRFFRRAS